LAYVLVIAAGVSIAFQQVLNGDLRTALGSPWWAGLISYLGGILVFAVALLVSSPPKLTGTLIARTSWITWTGGFFGAAFIAISAIMVPRLGVATTLSFVVAGQMLGSLVFDQLGLLSLSQHSVTPTRLLGVGLLIAAVVLIRA
jgi:transporter family-2 protein